MEDQQTISEAPGGYYEESVEVPTPVESTGDVQEEREGLIRRKYVTARTPLTAPPAGGPPVQYIRVHEPPTYRRYLLPALLVLALLVPLWYFASAPRTFMDENGKVWELPPGSKLGSWYLPFVGETLEFMNSPFTFGLDHAKSFGPVSYSNVLWQDTIVLSGRALFDFYNNTRIGRRGAYPVQVVDLFGGEIMPMLDEPYHSHRREWLQNGFGTGFTESHLDKIEEQVKESIFRWEDTRNFHWVAEFRRLTARIAGALLFNDPEGGEHHEKDFEAVIAAITSIPWSLPASKYRAGETARDNILEWINDYAAAQMYGEKTGLELGRILHRELRGDLLTLNSAVREFHHLALSTYGIHNALSFMVQALSKYADVWRRAKAEVASVTAIGHITVEKLQQLTYLGQLIDEVRRFYPIFPGVFGYVKEAFTIDDYYLPKDSIVFASLYASNHDPTIFRNPHIFDPSRFYQAGLGRETTVEKPFNYYTHGAGGLDNIGRRCMGEDLTSSIMKIVLVHLLRGYSWELPSQNLDPKLDGLLPIPKGGLRVHSFMQSDSPIKADYQRK